MTQYGGEHPRRAPRRERYRDDAFCKRRVENTGVYSFPEPEQNRDTDYCRAQPDDGFRDKNKKDREECPRSDSCVDSAQRAQQNDMALILPMILLLMGDKCDFMLVFALMYILM